MEDTIEISEEIFVEMLKRAYKQGYAVPIEEKNEIINNILEDTIQKLGKSRLEKNQRLAMRTPTVKMSRNDS